MVDYKLLYELNSKSQKITEQELKDKDGFIYPEWLNEDYIVLNNPLYKSSDQNKVSGTIENK